MVPGKAQLFNVIRRAREAFCRACFKPVALGQKRR